jgi:WbqC-like protein family.
MFEKCENYIKQSYRNRCCIATANGAMNLTIPIEGGNKDKILIQDIKISYSTAWQQQHWRAIEAAYRSSAFFEYYKDDFIHFYEKQWTFLWDFNFEIQEKVLKLLDIEKNISFTKTYEQQTTENILDFRDNIHPKKTKNLDTKQYYQVFDSKFGFIADLSIIDLLFNMGNESVLYL